MYPSEIEAESVTNVALAVAQDARLHPSEHRQREQAEKRTLKSGAV